MKARYWIFFTIAILFGSFSPSVASNISIAFDSIECENLKKFSKSQRDNLVYAYNFGASKGMGYTMAAIAWQESCAGEYMVNFADPSAGLYHAHIPVVLKYYSNYKDTSFTRNVMGQTLINNRSFSSQVALDTLLYWKKYHSGDYKNMIKSYNKGFKWIKDSISDSLAESYYKSVAKKVRALESYIPRYTSVKNQSVRVELEDKNKAIKQTFKTLQDTRQSSKDTKNNDSTNPKTPPSIINKKPINPKVADNQTQETDSNKPKDSKDSKDSSLSKSKNTKQKDITDTPNKSLPKPFERDFEDFNLIFEG